MPHPVKHRLDTLPLPAAAPIAIRRDSNRPSLLTLLRGWNLCAEVVDLAVAA